MTIVRRRQEIRAMTNMTAAFQHASASHALAAHHVQPVKLGLHDMETSPISSSPRTSNTKKEKIYRRKLTKAEVGARARADLAKKGMLPDIQPDDIRQSQTSQGALQRGFWGTLYDNTLGVLESALAEDETKPETVKPHGKPSRANKETARTGPSVDRPSMESFLKHIEGKFTCQRLGRPCIARPGEPFPRVVIIGWEHTGISEEWGEGLIAHFKRPGDKVIVEVAPADLEDENIHKIQCMGLSKNDCIAGEIQIVKDALDEAAFKTIELEYLMLAVLDPGPARTIWENNYKQPYVLSRLLQEQYGKSYPLRAPFLSAEQAAEINRLHQIWQELNSKVLQWNGVREQNYVRILESEMTNQEGTIYVTIGAMHAENLGQAFSNDDRVIALNPTSHEPRRNPRVLG
jgi:hypothetical protein